MVSVSAGMDFSIGVDSNGVVYSWGRDQSDHFFCSFIYMENINNYHTFPPFSIPFFSFISISYTKLNKKIGGQLGMGTAKGFYIDPTTVSTTTSKIYQKKIIQVAASRFHTLALQDTGGSY